jgi:hypothetical protein
MSNYILYPRRSPDGQVRLLANAADPRALPDTNSHLLFLVARGPFSRILRQWQVSEERDTETRCAQDWSSSGLVGNLLIIATDS